MGDYVYGEEKR